MSAENNRATVERMFDLINRNQVEHLYESVADSVVVHSTMLTDPKGDIRDLRQLFTLVRNGFPDVQTTVDQIASEGEMVAVRFIFAGTHLGELRGNDPTGRQVSWQEGMFFRFDEGKVHEIWHIINVMEVLEKLGVLPSERVRARIALAVKAFRKLGRLVRPGRG